MRCSSIAFQSTLLLSFPTSFKTATVDHATMDDLVGRLDDLVEDQLKVTMIVRNWLPNRPRSNALPLQVVSYKWLARQFKVPYDTAKQVLYDYVTRHNKTVKPTFFLSGWTDKTPSSHRIRIVSSSALDSAKSELRTVTGMHVYSIAPSVPKDTSDVYNADFMQSDEMFRAFLEDRSLQFFDNSLVNGHLSSLESTDVEYKSSGKEKSRPEAGAEKIDQLPSKSSLPAIKKAAAVSKANLAPNKGASTTHADTTKLQKGAVPPVKKAIIESSESESEASDFEAEQMPQRSEDCMVKGDETDKETKNNGATRIEERGKKRKSLEPGVKRRRKIMKTYYNDAGEEVTEMVEVTDDERTEEKLHLQPSPPKSTGKPNRKVPGRNQPGIMSFFGKK